MLGNIFNIARSAIHAHQTAVQVAGQNLSNGQTEGYSRQRANLQTAVPVRTPMGTIGTGVRVTDISRTRDTLLDTTFRREAGNASNFGLRRELLGQVEEIFGELDDAGFSRTLDAFWSSWSDMASTPTNGSVRGLIKLNAQQVIHSLHNYTARLDALRHSTNERIDRRVQDVNVLASQLAEVNRQIRVFEGLGRSAPDLQDQRDRVLDELSRIVPVQVIERSDRTVGVYVGTVSLVDGSEWRQMVLDPTTQQVRVGTSAIPLSGGEIGALIGVRDGDIQQVQERLDDFARVLVQEVNAAHTAGTNLHFFDPVGVSARSIALSTDIDVTANIGSIPGRPGDNSAALGIAELREKLVAFPGSGSKSFGAFYGDIVADVGLRLNAADRSATVYETLASQADTRRAAVAGVSSDEELMNLMRHQQAYAAATRLISAADEMLKSILALV